MYGLRNYRKLKGDIMSNLTDEILYLNRNGLVDSDICFLLGMRYTQFKKDIKKIDYSPNKKSKKVYPYVYKNDGGIYYYVYMKNNNKYFCEFLDKEMLLKSIESENWEQPMIL